MTDALLNIAFITAMKAQAERDTALLRRCLELIKCSGVKHPDLIAERDQLERDLRERLGEGT